MLCVSFSALTLLFGDMMDIGPVETCAIKVSVLKQEEEESRGRVGDTGFPEKQPLKQE